VLGGCKAGLLRAYQPGTTDLAAVCRAARARDICTVVDNTFATPYNQRPLALGAEVVIHSGTKYLGGHSDVLGGCVVTDAATSERLWHKRTLFGGVLDPFAAWLLLRGTKTLALRVERQNQNALALAQALESHPAVRRVHYPGLPSCLCDLHQRGRKRERGNGRRRTGRAGPKWPGDERSAGGSCDADRFAFLG